MGEALARQRAKAFSFQQDEAYTAEMKTKGLFSDRPEIFHTDYPCRVVPGQSVSPGTEVLLRRSSPGNGAISNQVSGSIEVVVWNQISAIMQNEAGTALSESMERDPKTWEGVSAVVVSESPLDGFISVRCVVEKPNEKQ